MPLIALLGQTRTDRRHREAFQEVELAAVFAPLVKWAVEVPAAERIAEIVLRAGRVSISGRPGPVAVILREDLSTAEVPAPERVTTLRPPRPAPDPGTVAATMRILRAARRPVMVVGEGVISAGATTACVQFAEAEGLPVVTAWRRPDAFPNDHPSYLGWAGLRSPATVRDLVGRADAVLVLGTRLDEFTSERFSAPPRSATIVHVDLDAEGLGGHRHADVACHSDAGLFLAAALDASGADPAPQELLAGRRRWVMDERACWEAATTPGRGRARPGFVDQQVVSGHLRRLLPPDAITVTDGGNFAGWPARYLRWNRPGTFLGPVSGAMGYAVPAAIGAKLARPSAPVVAFAGDGGFLMTGIELETAVREDVPIVVVVFDNHQYGTIRMHQERSHPGGRLGSDLGEVDFAAFARSLGAVGHTVRDEAEFPGAFEDARNCGRPALLHLRVDPEQLFVGDDEAAPQA